MLCSCGGKNADAKTSESTESYDADYTFENGEQIHWEVVKENDFIVVKAFLNQDWNTYSIYNTNILGPLPTLISFDNNDHFELVGKVEEVGLKNKYYDEWESNLGYFEDIAVFKQKIKPISGEEFVVSGNVNYIICNSTTCLPPADYHFELSFKP